MGANILQAAILLVLIGMTVTASVLSKEFKISLNKKCPDMWSLFPFDYTTYDNDSKRFVYDYGLEKRPYAYVEIDDTYNYLPKEPDSDLEKELIKLHRLLKQMVIWEKDTFLKFAEMPPNELNLVKVEVQHWLRELELCMLDVLFFHFRVSKQYNVNFPEFYDTLFNAYIRAFTDDYIKGMKFYHKHFSQLESA